MSDAGKSGNGTLIVHLILHVMRLYLGAWMVINGLNHWFPIFPQPFGGSVMSQLFITTLVDSGLFGVAKAAEVIGGLLLILNLFSPFALALLLPVSAMVYFNATVLQGRWLRVFGENGLYMGTFCFYFNLILILAYIRHYIPLLSMNSSIGTWRDITSLGSIFATADTAAEPGEVSGRAALAGKRKITGQWLVSAGVGVLLCFVVVWQLRPLAVFSVSSGKTARHLIVEYLELAYGQGRGADAAKLYFDKAAVDSAADAIDRANGAPIPHEVVDIIADGMTVAVHHRIAASRGVPAMDVVDIYKADRFSKITERRRIPAAAISDGTGPK